MVVKYYKDKPFRGIKVMKITIKHKNQIIVTLDDEHITDSQLWDNLIEEIIEYTKHLHATEGGMTIITLESKTAPII